MKLITRRHAGRSLRWQAILYLGVFLALAAPSASLQSVLAQGSLDDIRQSVRVDDSPPPTTPSPSPPPKSSKKAEDRRFDHVDGYDDEDEWWVKPVVYIIGGVLTSPFWAPPVLLDDDYSRRGYFPRFPYEGSLDGYMMIDPWVPEHPYPWATRVNVEYASTFDDLSSVNSRLLFQRSRFGVDGEFVYRTENSEDISDELFTGDLNIVFRFAQTPKVQMRTGLGVNWLSDETDEDFGFNFTYGGDWFPRRPWIVSADLDLGKLGNATLLHVRASVGAQFHGTEIYVGYDFYDVDETQISSVVSGLRFWF